MTICEPDVEQRQLLTRRPTEQERELERLRAEVQAWRERVGRTAGCGTMSSSPRVSGRALEPVYTAARSAGRAAARERLPGEYPYTRGIHPTMYRGRLWTMRQFAGFGTAEDTNARYKFLLARGPDRALGRLRLPDADGLRLRPPPLRGRGREVRRRRSRAWRTWRRCSTGFRSTRSPPR